MQALDVISVRTELCNNLCWSNHSLFYIYNFYICDFFIYLFHIIDFYWINRFGKDMEEKWAVEAIGSTSCTYYYSCNDFVSHSCRQYWFVRKWNFAGLWVVLDMFCMFKEELMTSAAVLLKRQVIVKKVITCGKIC